MFVDTPMDMENQTNHETAEQPDDETEEQVEVQEHDEEDYSKKEEEELVAKVNKLMDKITASPDNPKSTVLHALASILKTQESRDKSISGHSVTLRETVEASFANFSGATAFEISGTPVDCVSLALSGALFSWSKPMMVIYGHHMFYSGVVAGAREALLFGVPSLSISLNWKKDESQETDFKDATSVCLPLINAAINMSSSS